MRFFASAAMTLGMASILRSVTRTLNTTMQWSERSLWLGSDAAHTQIPPLKRSEFDCAG